MSNPRSPFSSPAQKVSKPGKAGAEPVKPFHGKPEATTVGSGGKRVGAGTGQLERQAGPKSSPRPRPQGQSVVKISFGAVISRRASERLAGGHLWVYGTDVESISAGKGETPALLPVADNRGLLLGTALYSPISQIALRMVSREAIDEAQWLALLSERLRRAIARRLPLLNVDTNACRLVFSEADDLPGLVVDKYADLVIVQLLSKGLDKVETRAVCVRVLREALAGVCGALTIWERPDPRIRELEGLSAPSTGPLFADNFEDPVTRTLFRLNGLSFNFDVGSGQKTGAFLDQRENYDAAALWARNRQVRKALDVCTYQGGFALHLARAGATVTGVDASRASLEVAERNQEANRGILPKGVEVDWVEADAFELLRAWSDSGEHADFDLIVLDPPAFAKSKRAVEGALRGYKELNLRALRMIKPGGLLITCSCSHHVTWTDLEGAVAGAAVDTGRRVTLLERRGAAQDHPVLLNLPETEYLKCLICQVD